MDGGVAKWVITNCNSANTKGVVCARRTAWEDIGKNTYAFLSFYCNLENYSVHKKMLDYTKIFSKYKGCYAQPAEEVANSTHSLTSDDPVKECRDKCQPAINHARSTNFAMYFWISKDDSECNCLPNYPLGGKNLFIILIFYI